MCECSAIVSHQSSEQLTQKTKLVTMVITVVTPVSERLTISSLAGVMLRHVRIVCLLICVCVRASSTPYMFSASLNTHTRTHTPRTHKIAPSLWRIHEVYAITRQMVRPAVVIFRGMQHRACSLTHTLTFARVVVVHPAKSIWQPDTNRRKTNGLPTNGATADASTTTIRSQRSHNDAGSASRRRRRRLRGC